MPAVGRNNGAKAAKGEFLFFFDSDVRLPRGFLKKAHDEIQERFLDLATCPFRPLSNLRIDKAMHDFAVAGIRLSQFSVPHAPGFCIFVSKRLFERVGGFDESIRLAEDHDFVKRASKFRPMRVLDSVHIYVSVRRLKKEGRLTLIRKYLGAEFLRLFKGELKDEVIKYEFGDFRQHDEQRLDRFLRSMDSQIMKMEREYNRLAKKYLKR
jgi:glycosyltransferase involved in cell wall biosynthesis